MCVSVLLLVSLLSCVVFEIVCVCVCARTVPKEHCLELKNISNYKFELYQNLFHFL